MKLYIDDIAKLRKSKNISINSLADYLGRTRHTISNWLHERSTPSKAEIIAMAHIFGVSASDISDLPSMGLLEDINDGGKNIENSIYLLDNIIKEYGDVPAVSVEHLVRVNDTIKRTLKENQRCNKTITRYSTLLNSIDLIVYVKDSKRFIKRVNSSFIDQCSPGYTEEEIIGDKFIDLFGRKEIADIIELENRVFSSGVYVRDEKIKIPGTAKKIGLISISPIFDSENKVIEVVASIKDVTGISNLVKKEKLLKDILNKLENEWVWIKRFNPLKFEFISSGAGKTLGFDIIDYHMSPDDLLARIHPEDRYMYEKTTLPENYPFCIKFRVLDKNNVTIWLDFRGFKTLDKDKKPLYYGISRDITREVNTERGRLELEHAINSSDLVILATRYSFEKMKILKYEYISDNIYEVMKIKKDDLLSDKISWLNMIVESDKPAVVEWLENRIASKNMTFRLKKGNSVKWIYARAIAENYTKKSKKKLAGDEVVFYVYMRDITKYKAINV
ncbi:MAG: PAS domain S-box protein [bacterium]|nr:PAS domain S-box protein [bacterium]